MIVRFSVLSPEEQETIHHAALSVLEGTGIRVHNASLFRILQQAGAPIGRSNQVLTLPRQMVEDALAAAPKECYMMDQLGYPYAFPAAEPYFIARVLLPQVLDYGERQARTARKDDVVNLCRLANSLPKASFVYKTDCQCSDLPEELNYLETIAAVYRSTTKPCFANPINPIATRYWVELGEAATGKTMREQPILRCGVAVTSPFQIDTHSAEHLIYLARNGVPISCMSMPIAGMSSPITLAGVIVQHVAEVLALITAVQLINPGNPVLIAGSPCGMHMNTGDIIMSSPAICLLGNALTTMGRYYGLPSAAGTSYTDSSATDIQCGMEKAFSNLFRMAAGSDGGMHGGDLRDAMVVSYEQLLIDYDLWEASNRLLQGFSVNPDTLALEVIERVGPDGAFLTDPHTLSWLRNNEEQFLSEFFTMGGARGEGPLMLEKAHARVNEILASDWESPVPLTAIERIDTYVSEERLRILAKH